MPQLDIATFFNQIFWVSLFFYVTYFSLLKSVIPTFSKILKLRFKIISLYIKDIFVFSQSSKFFLKSTLSSTLLILNK